MTSVCNLENLRFSGLHINQVASLTAHLVSHWHERMYEELVPPGFVRLRIGAFIEEHPGNTFLPTVKVMVDEVASFIPQDTWMLAQRCLSDAYRSVDINFEEVLSIAVRFVPRGGWDHVAAGQGITPCV